MLKTLIWDEGPIRPRWKRATIPSGSERNVFRRPGVGLESSGLPGEGFQSDTFLKPHWDSQHGLG